MRLGASLADASVTFPDGQKTTITAAELQRPSRIEIVPEGAEGQQSVQEIYGPTRISLRLPEGRLGVIRYTLDGTEPDSQSAEFTEPFKLDHSATVKAAAFLPDGMVVGRNAVDFRLVRIPEAGLIGEASFERWNGETGVTKLDARSTAWIAPGAARLAVGNETVLSVHRESKGRPLEAAVDINVARPQGTAGLKLAGLRMRDNAITVGMWFRSDTADGRLFGKDGLTAFGKRYRTASCSLDNGRVVGVPGDLAGGEVKPGEWTQVVLTADANESRLYVDGKEVARGSGSATLATDALDFFASHPADIAEIRIYERVLSPEDIRRWHDATEGRFAHNQ